ncbi:MAG: chemotaxis protein CheB, partial [Clostridiales bacterium]|nr:chemotaxis protein CheB [Clostridiales bacterium]
MEELMASRTITNVKSDQQFPVIAVGASAGGLKAIEAFFTGMPAENGVDMAFVVLQHLAPDHKSILAEIIRRYTRMKVFEVEGGMHVKPNCIYTIPPNRNMAILNGAFQLFEPDAPRGQNLPIDFFFRSLAKEFKNQAICVVLSGTGSDGTLGLEEVKAQGGMVIAQRTDTSEYEGMPLSAISTGLTDYQLPPGEMAVQIIDHIKNFKINKMKSGNAPLAKAETE